MPKRGKARLVIDASVARSAGGHHAAAGVSKSCRGFLVSILDLAYRVVMTPEISQEWKRHRSRRARKWLNEMSGRKLVVRIDSPADAQLRGRIQDAEATATRRRAMLKDAHLLEAALATDRRVASLDDEVRGLFRKLAEAVRTVAKVVWVNPAAREERATEWLQNGAPAEGQRQLGHRS